MIWRTLADLVLVLHFCFVLFVILGGLLALRWPRLVSVQPSAIEATRLATSDSRSATADVAPIVRRQSSHP